MPNSILLLAYLALLYLVYYNIHNPFSFPFPGHSRPAQKAQGKISDARYYLIFDSSVSYDESLQQANKYCSKKYQPTGSLKITIIMYYDDNEIFNVTDQKGSVAL
ncbi:conserved hypothetical protein [Trichinella spiralis]|uniref:hypothetical protein n=1 Tax=Trichinella spiralis TaxID=6334 RepID=UPI0001EFCB58|nr:conserved hypothetical protein [Trichinella spiralis]